MLKIDSLAADNQSIPVAISPAEAGLMLSRQRARWFQIYIAVTLADFFAIALGVLWSSLVWFDGPDTEMFIRLFVVLEIIYFFTILGTNSYSHGVFSSRRKFVFSAVQAMLISIAVCTFTIFMFKGGNSYSRGHVFLSGLSTIALVALLRYFLWSRIGLRDGDWVRAKLVIVDGIQVPNEPYAAIVCAEALGLSPDTSSAESVEHVCAIAGAFDQVVVHCPPERRLAWAQTLRCLGVRCGLRIPELDPLRPLSVSASDGLTAAVVSDRSLEPNQMFLKRTFDICVTLALMPMLVPFMAVVAIAIKLDSKGPVLFRQRRLGLGNRSFMMLKFRSMHVDRQDKDAKKLTTRNDSRVTRVGRFIRKTSIDELPQFFNVLLGDMSIVGPRPHALMAMAGTRLYWEVDRKYWYRHVTKPGITGLAQIRGYRGNTFEENDLRSRLESDLEYVSSWSLWRDVEILLATVRVLHHDKAF